MINIRRYTSEDNVLWNQLVNGSRNGMFMFNRNYMDYHADRYEDYSLMFFKENELISVLPASLHNRTEVRSHGGLTFGGLICSYSVKQQTINACFEELIKYLRNNKIERLIYKPIPYIYHSFPCQEDLYMLWRNNAVVYRRDVSTVIDLTNDIIKLPKGRKAQISRAKREGIVVEKSTDFHTFIALENQVLEKHHQTKAVHTAEELQLLHSRFPEQICLYAAMYKKEMVAGVLLYVYDNLVHTQYMGSSDFSRENGGLDLIIATIIDEYKGKKQYLDFGISTVDAGWTLNMGLVSQKESFGGRSVIYDFYELVV
jgi:hypothetical protein